MAGSNHLATARLAEQAERYSDMCAEMRAATEQNNGVISEDERNLFSIAYKTVVGQRRSSWRAMCNIEKKNAPLDERDPKMANIKAYKTKIEVEIKEVCEEVLGILANLLIPGAVESSAKVFYMKMKGDYLRYLAEISLDDHISAAAAAYQEAWEVSTAELQPTHPVHLGLVLNYSVYYYEILNDAGKACELAKQAFEDATSTYENSKEDLYKHVDGPMIVGLIRDNLALWGADEEGREHVE